MTISISGNVPQRIALSPFYGLMGILFIAHLCVGYWQNLALFYDEAYYQFWSMSLDWGYYSKPPMVAWLIALSTSAFGYSESAVRLFSPLLYAATAWVIYAIALHLYRQQSIARWAAVIFFSMPLVTFNSLFITTDAPLLFFWALAILCYLRCQQNSRTLGWLLLGAVAGLGLLSKYTMVVVLISLLIVTLQNRRYRLMLRSRGPWLSIIVCCLFFAPNLWWNFQHDFISFQHTSEISHLNQQWFHPNRLLEFLAGQFFTFGPLAMGLFITGLVRREAPEHSSFLLWTSLPMLGIICLQAFLAKANMNWAAPAFISASIWVAAWLSERKLPHWNYLLIAMNLMLAVVFYSYPQILHLTGIAPTAKNTPYHRVSGWRELAQQLPVAPATGGYLSDSRAVLSYVSYYQGAMKTGEAPKLAAFNPDGHIKDHFQLSHDITLFSRKTNWIFISEHADVDLQCFTHVSPLQKVQQQVYPTLTRTWYLFQVSGFHGYENC